ncbi:MAG: ABC transporter ATP-binding protein [Lachnospiraceae bacterium]|nr:ABC transporter ATP-binding protein [Lachnospiraceae bacterium]
MDLIRFSKNVYGRKIYFQTILMMLLSFATAASQFLATQHLGDVIDAVERGYAETMHHVLVIAVSLMLYILGIGAFTFLSGKLSSDFSRCLQIKVGKKICSTQYQEIEQMNDGDLLTMITKDIDSIRSWFGLVMKFGFLPACLGLAPVAMFRWCNWKFALLALCLIPLNAVPSIFFAKKLSPFHDNEKKAYTRVLSHFTESLQFVMLIKAFQLEQLFRSTHRENLDKYRKARKRRMLFERLAEEYNRCYGHITRILILFSSAYFIYSGEMTFGRLTSVILLSNFIGEGLIMLSNIPLLLPAAKVGVIRIQKLLKLQEEAVPNNRIETVRQPNEATIYEVHGLSFSYGNTTVLHDINFCVNQGEKIAVVGLSGCGKTTLFKLLSGLYTPEKNQIYFKGMDISELSPEYLRKNITVTTQEPFLFQATLKDNIQVAKSDGVETEIIAACKNAQLNFFILTLPDGYNSEINTTVHTISNGQMQRINLARAFLRNANVFLLDEPTSALDSGTAQAIWDYLFIDCADKTMLVILHDLEEVSRFHKVLVLDHGKTAGYGTHEELIQSCGLYRILYQEKMADRRKMGS